APSSAAAERDAGSSADLVLQTMLACAIGLCLLGPFLPWVEALGVSVAGVEWDAGKLIAVGAGMAGLVLALRLAGVALLSVGALTLALGLAVLGGTIYEFAEATDAVRGTVGEIGIGLVFGLI